MSRWLAWWVKGECLFRHAEPLHDRVDGVACFRCPACLATWPVLVGQGRTRPQ